MKAGHSAAGRSIVEMLFEQAQIKYWHYNDHMEEGGGWDDDALDASADEEMSKEELESIAKYWRLKGELNALCYAIAMMRNPYKPNINEVKKEVAAA